MYSYKYPHPSLTADCVVFGFDGKALHLLLVERADDPYKGFWALPGGFMKIDETIEACARRELKEETNVDNVFLEQFHVFSDVHRDTRERIVTVAFLALVCKSDYHVIGGDDASDAAWFNWEELPPLAFDHNQIILMAKERLREKLRTEPIAFKLLDDKFKMSELQRLYELICGTKYDRRNFQRKMMSSGFVNEESAVVCNAMPQRSPAMFRIDSDRYEQTKSKDDNMKYPFDF